MNRTIFTGIALVLALNTPIQAGVRLLKPTAGARMSLTVGKQARLYFRVASGESSGVDVEGPGELKFIVRAIPGEDGASTIAYSMVVSEGKQPLKTVHAETVRIATRWTGSGEPATQARSFKVVVPQGRHHFTLRFDSKEAAAAGVRYVYRWGTEKQLPLFGTGGRETVALLVKEKPWDYYVADPLRPVEADVIGPVRLRVVSRLVFRDGARGNQSYTVTVERDGKPIADHSFVTTKSAVAECESHPDWILGKSRTFYIEIPKGQHHVVLRPSGGDAPGVAMRLSIPNKGTQDAN